MGTGGWLAKTVRTDGQKGAPPRGPRMDLCVVVVTTSEEAKGLSTTPAATRPLHGRMNQKTLCCVSAGRCASALERQTAVPQSRASTAEGDMSAQYETSTQDLNGTPITAIPTPGPT